tara:strand:+ start:622 stop:978 length:357 start_codon:yes stop_codon:yes gene_type:complete
MTNFKEIIKERFDHIDFNTIDFDLWFFKSYLPTVILKSIGAMDTNPDGSGSYDIELMQAISSYLETYHQTPVLKEKPIAPIKSITRKIYDKETGEIFAEVPRDLSFRKAGLEDDMGIT